MSIIEGGTVRRVLVAAAAAGLFAAWPTLPAAHAATCAGHQASPRLSIRVSDSVPTPEQTVYVGGYLTGERGCVVAGVRVGMFFRERPGAFSWLATTVTNDRGQYQFTYRHPRQYDVMTVHSADSTAGRAISVAPDGRYYVHVHVIPQPIRR